MKKENIVPKREYHSELKEQKRMKAYAKILKALIEKGKAGDK